jgi:hypothetical protein
VESDLLIKMAIGALEVAVPENTLWQGDAQLSYQLQLQEIIWQLYSEIHEW